MIWWLSDPSRARSEMAGVAELEERSPWLNDVTWAVESPAKLVARFTIQVLSRAIPLKMDYPGFFPDAPPQVLTVEPERLSLHQYGAAGELCLEYRPDNWSPEFTGAMMIESAYRLLIGEAPSEGQIAEVPSAHRVSFGQELRGTWLRLVLPTDLRANLVAMEPAQVTALELVEHKASGCWILNPVRLGLEEEPLWSAEKPVEDATTRSGWALRLGPSGQVPALTDRGQLRGLLNEANATDALNQLDAALREFFILVASTDEIKMVSLPVGQDTVFRYDTIILPEPQARLSEEHAALASKAVAIVGCGSMGSKIAASLARAGVGRFVLVDEDVLIPGNLVRNDLDARSVGLHKADGVAARIKNINPRAAVNPRRIALGGQEASASADNALKAIAGCDLIVEATADPQGFNLCASVARRGKKPLIWGEVFAGGVGGLVARSRPDLDPPPHHARRQLLTWCEARGVPWEGGSAIDYDLHPLDRPPLIANDAAVSAIAGHMTAIATDILLREADSRFPSSAYAIGLVKEWIFSGPFDVWPIDYSPEGTWGETVTDDQAEQLQALVADLLPNLPDSDDEA